MRAWVAASVLTVLLHEYAAQCAAAVRVNTWSACSLDAIPDGFPALSAQCATAVVPLCAGGICQDVDSQAINLYLKRISATSTSVKTTRNLWVVPDRSDYVSASQVDTQLQAIFRQLGGDVSVYTLDQRGTGRSSQITCDTSSVTIDTTTVQRCSEALSVVLGDNLVAFSITSAAYDLVSLITLLHAKTEVFVYGLGYGTLVVERLLHFGLADVKGYILDGSAATSGAKKSSFAYISQADEEFGLIGDDFLALCEKDSTCSAKFQDKSVTKVLSNLITSLDNSSVTDDSNCASVFQVTTTTSTTASTTNSSKATTSSADPASYKLRRALAMLMQNVTERAFIPVLLYRLNRCSSVDKPVVQNLLARLLQREADLKAQKEVVYDLIAFSELWESPSAMEKRLSARFTETSISSGRIYDQLLRYCLFTGDTSTACTELGVNNNTSATTNSTRLAYARDSYWNTAATIPSTSSVLLLSGDLDGQSPPQYAQDLEDALIGTSKELLEFKAGTHNVLTSSTLDDGTSCGLAILESYVTSSGDISKYDTSCIDKLPSLSFTLTRSLSLAVFNTTDAYDGALVTSSNSSSGSNSGNISTGAPPSAGSNSSSSSLEKENESLRQVIRRYRVAFIVVTTMLVVMLVVFAVILLRWWREKQYRDEQKHELLLRGEGGDDNVDDESMRKHHMESTINFKSLSSEERDWNADSTDIQPPSSDSMDWNFRSNPRNGEDDDSGEFGFVHHPIAPPPFSDWTYSSSNHLRM